MPRIAAANIEEHVRQQTSRILNAASALFSEHGYRGTDMGDIANAMGLARNSLYRYYSSKDHILVAVMQRDMVPYVERIEALEYQHPSPRARMVAWLELQMELATGPCHTTMKMLGDMRESSKELRREIGALHEPPRRVLESAVADLLEGSGRDAQLISAMIASMVQSAGLQAMESKDVDGVGRELSRSVLSVLGDGEGL
jgi:AcrR family transcriptional regulator